LLFKSVDLVEGEGSFVAFSVTGMAVKDSVSRSKNMM
jgi:hypothetical protein